MNILLHAARLVDLLNSLVGRSVRWLILVAVLVSAGNAIVRKAFQTSSNAMLEIQWYLFAAVFLLCAGYALLKDVHVRIDFIAARLSVRARAWMDILGLILFALPLCWLLIHLSIPLVLDAFLSGETSPNAGGLLRWPAYGLLPLGMLLLLLQCLSELVKRIAFLRGLKSGPDPQRLGGAEQQNPALPTHG